MPPEKITTFAEAKSSSRLEQERVPVLMDELAKSAFSSLLFSGTIDLTPHRFENIKDAQGGRYTVVEMARAIALFVKEIQNPKPESIARWQENSIIPNANGTYTNWTNIPTDNGQWNLNNTSLLQQIKQGINLKVTEDLILPNGSRASKEISDYKDLVRVAVATFNNPSKHQLRIQFDNGFAFADLADMKNQEANKKQIEGFKNNLLVEYSNKNGEFNLLDTIHRYSEADKTNLIEAIIEFRSFILKQGGEIQLEGINASLVNLQQGKSSKNILQDEQEIRYFLERNLFNPAKEFKGLKFRNIANKEQENRHKQAQESLDRIAEYRKDLVNTVLASLNRGGEFNTTNFINNRLKSLPRELEDEFVEGILQGINQIKKNNPQIDVYGFDQSQNNRLNFQKSVDVYNFLQEIVANPLLGKAIVLKFPNQPLPQPIPQNPQSPTSPDFEQKEQFVTINEFSTGLNLHQSHDGTYYSRGFTTQFMHKTEKNIPKEVLDTIYIGENIGLIRDDKVSIIIQETAGYSILTTASNFKDEQPRNFNACRFFYTPKNDNSLENILANAAKFEPANKNPDPNKPALTDQSLENNQQLITQNEGYITDTVNSFKPGNPVLINPINPPVPSIVIEIAKRISKKFNLPLSAAININGIENPNSFLVILPSNRDAGNKILDQMKNNYGVRPDTYETVKIKDTIKKLKNAIPKDGENSETMLKRPNFQIVLQEFNDLWLKYKGNPQEMDSDFDKLGLKILSEKKTYDFEGQNLILLAYLLNPSKINLERLNNIILSPIITPAKGLFGRETVNSVDSNKLKNKALIFLESLKNGLTDNDLKIRCNNLITVLTKTKF